MSTNVVKAAEWVLAAISSLFLLLRLHVRFWRRQRLILNDLFIMIAWVSFVSFCACDTKLRQLGLFADGETYKEKLIAINNDPDGTIQALKVCLRKIPLRLDYLWISFPILHNFMAC